MPFKVPSGHGPECQCFDCSLQGHATYIVGANGNGKPVESTGAVTTITLTTPSSKPRANGGSAQGDAPGEKYLQRSDRHRNLYGDSEAVPNTAQQGGNELRQLMLLMRGRMLLAAASALVLGCLGAFAGFKLGNTYYQSVGGLRVSLGSAEGSLFC